MNIFKSYPKLTVYYKTNDGTKFFTENSAKNHAKTLDDKTVTPVYRKPAKSKSSTSKSTGANKVTSTKTVDKDNGADTTLQKVNSDKQEKDEHPINPENETGKDTDVKSDLKATKTSATEEAATKETKPSAKPQNK